MSQLESKEVELLWQLNDRDQTISGNKPRQGIARLVKIGHVTEQSLNISDTVYSISESGCEALARI